MKATGIVRRIDDLGRIVIPKELRRACQIREGDPLEFFVDNTNQPPMVCLCKYETSLIYSLEGLADRIDDEMMFSATNGQREEVRKNFSEIIKILKTLEEH